MSNDVRGRWQRATRDLADAVALSEQHPKSATLRALADVRLAFWRQVDAELYGSGPSVDECVRALCEACDERDEQPDNELAEAEVLAAVENLRAAWAARSEG